MIVNYEGADCTAAMEAQVRDWAAELDTVCDRIARCDVRVDALACGPPPRDRRYRVRLAIAMPGAEIVVSRDPEAEREDASAALRDSFRAARRRLEEYVWRNPRDDLGPPGSPARAG